MPIFFPANLNIYNLIPGNLFIWLGLGGNTILFLIGIAHYFLRTVLSVLYICFNLDDTR